MLAALVVSVPVSGTPSSSRSLAPNRPPLIESDSATLLPASNGRTERLSALDPMSNMVPGAVAAIRNGFRPTDVQIVYVLLGHHLALVRRHGLEQFGFHPHRDLLAEPAHLQLEILLDMVADAQLQVLANLFLNPVAVR